MVLRVSGFLAFTSSSRGISAEVDAAYPSGSRGYYYSRQIHADIWKNSGDNALVVMKQHLRSVSAVHGILPVILTSVQ